MDRLSTAGMKSLVGVADVYDMTTVDQVKGNYESAVTNPSGYFNDVAQFYADGQSMAKQSGSVTRELGNAAFGAVASGLAKVASTLEALLQSNQRLERKNGTAFK